MKANTVNIKEWLEKENTFYSLPIFQRHYEWNENQIETLFDDIKIVSKIKKNHFIGTIIAVSNYDEDSKRNCLKLIDGQQRFTTIFLLIIALFHTIPEYSPDRYVLENQLKKMIYTSDENENKKLTLLEDDEDDLISILKHKDWNKNIKKSNLITNYLKFQELIKNSELDHSEIIDALTYLNFIFCETNIDENDDDPQDIYASLNGKGTPLSQGDLIKNSFLMKLKDKEEEENIYKNYWLKIENNVNKVSDFINKKEQDVDYLTTFFKDALMMLMQQNIPEKNQQIFRFFNAYKSQKTKDNSLNIESRETFSKRFLKLSEVYSKIINFKHNNKEINDLINKLMNISSTLKSAILYILMSENNNKLSGDQVVEILRIIFILFFRKKASGIRSDRNTGQIFTQDFFTSLPNIESQENEENLFEKIKQFLITKVCTIQEYLKMTDDQIIESLITLKFEEKFKNILQKLLFELEKFISKNNFKCNLNNWTVEHIMPQEINQSWKESLGENSDEIRSTYYKTLGNLTLINQDKEMGSISFQEKLNNDKYGFKAVEIKLNELVVSKEKWDKESIEQRSKALGNYLCQMYPLPEGINLNNLDNKSDEESILSKCSDFIRGVYHQIKNYLTKEYKVKFKFMQSSINCTKNNNFLISLVPQKRSLKIYFNKILGKDIRLDNLREMVDEQGNNINHPGKGNLEFTIQSGDYFYIKSVSEIMSYLLSSFNLNI